MMHLTRQRVGTRVCGGRPIREDVRGGLTVALWWWIPVVGLIGLQYGTGDSKRGFRRDVLEGLVAGPLCWCV